MTVKKIDDTARELESIEKQLYVLKLRKSELEQEVADELEERSSDTNWASELVGENYIIKRHAKNTIDPDELRHALGEWVSPEVINKMIRPENKKIVIEPAKVMLAEVNKIKKQGGIVAEKIEKVTYKQSNGIRVHKREV